MIIKSLSRRSKSFGQLLGNMQQEGIKRGGEPAEIFHNLPFLGGTKKSLLEEFQKNSTYLKERKNGVSLYHEIISLHPDDCERVTPQILVDIAQHYLETRAPQGLGYGVVHTNTKNPHIHLMISANTLASPQKIRLSKTQFQRIKKQMKIYLQKHYPFLTASLAPHSSKKKPKKSRAEKGMNFRNTNTQKFSLKDQVKNFVNSALLQATYPPDFEKNLQLQNIQLYTRGKQQGVIWKGKKYRLKTLGLAEQWEQQQEAWSLVKKRKKPVQSIFLEKIINDWKQKGYREKLLDLLTEKTQKRNKNFLQLRQIAERKRGHKEKGKFFRL